MVPFAARLSLASVLLMAAITKLPRFRQHIVDIQQYRLLPNWLATAYATVLPWLELGAAVALFAGVWTTVGAGLALILLTSFLVAVAAAMKRGLDVTCSCFGLLYRERVGWRTLIRDAVLATLALIVLLFDNSRFTVPTALQSLDRPPDAIALAVTVILSTASVILALLATGWPGLAAPLPRVATGDEHHHMHSRPAAES